MKKCLICRQSTHLLIDNLFDDRYGAPGKFSINQCPNCGFGRISPGLNEEEIGQFYARYYPLSAATAESVKSQAKISPSWKSWLLGTNNISHLATKPKDTVLDIGSASGVSLLEIKALGGEAYGVEPDPNAARIAKDLKLKVFSGQVTDNPFPKNTFDLISASQVIEHTPDPTVFLDTVAVKLNKNGRIVLSFPNVNSFYRHLFGRYWINWHVPYHYNFFTKKSLAMLANQKKLRVTKIKTITPNDWTLLQLFMFIFRPKANAMQPIWAEQHKKTKDQNLRSILRQTIRYTILIILLPIITIANRTIDALGCGESFLVELKRTND
ncbi:MAG: class I SAM-dependent methyltransferase [Patescibacteria group bacterium]|jgi:SAM-dependent methyltransferase